MFKCPKCEKEVETLYKKEEYPEAICYFCIETLTASYGKAKKLCHFLNDLKFNDKKFMCNSTYWICIDLIQYKLQQMNDKEIDKIFSD